MLTQLGWTRILGQFSSTESATRQSTYRYQRYPCSDTQQTSLSGWHLVLLELDFWLMKLQPKRRPHRDPQEVNHTRNSKLREAAAFHEDCSSLYASFVVVCLLSVRLLMDRALRIDS